LFIEREPQFKRITFPNQFVFDSLPRSPHTLFYKDPLYLNRGSGDHGTLQIQVSPNLASIWNSKKYPNSIDESLGFDP
jgi:hypothetical protein